MPQERAGDGAQINEILVRSTEYLGRHGSSNPRLDAEILLAYALGIRRIDLYLSPERPLSLPELDRARELVRRRGNGEPSAYLVGRREFHGLSFEVTPAVLIPRPETEAVVDAALEVLARASAMRPVVADVGTGSGAIACALATGCPASRVMATDISSEALAVAQQNVDRLGLGERVSLYLGDLLTPLPQGVPLDLVVSNPPYVATGVDDGLSPDVAQWEPWLALDGGPDGMQVTARLIVEARDRLRPGGSLVFEVGSIAQRERAEALLRAADGFQDVMPCLDVAKVVRGLRCTRV